MFLHYIWDFDGTMFNSYPHMSRAFQKSLQEFGVDEPTRNILQYMKQSVGSCVDFYREKYDLGPELRDIFNRNDSEGALQEIAPYPDLKEVLMEIISSGGKNYIYTHRKKSVFDYINAYQLEMLFTDAVTMDDNFPPKPAPDALLNLISRHSMEKRTVLMTGDRDIDVLAGVNAGVSACLFDPEDYFTDYKTDYRVQSMLEFREMFLKAGE
jgi:phosphoglycolate phosphatase-like HAD superfamily hydrolase